MPTGLANDHVDTIEPAETTQRATGRLNPVVSAALSLFAAAASFVVLAGLLLARRGPYERLETELWVVAFGLALPLGFWLAERQKQRLTDAPEAAGPWAIATGLVAIAAALMLLRDGAPDRLHYVLIVFAGAVALYAPFAAARSPRKLRRAIDTSPVAARVTAWVALAIIGLLFTPDTVLAGRRLGIAISIAAIVLAAVLIGARIRQSRRTRRLVDTVALGVLALVVFTAPDLNSEGFAVIYNHNFFLGPVNDMIHGRTMLVDTFSQYGVGLFYALRAAFLIVPFGYGGMALIVTATTTTMYLLTYVTLRAAISSQVLVIFAMAVAALGNIFLQSGTYVAVPSTGALRFGIPYLVIAAAVLRARRPSSSRLVLDGQLVLLGVSSIWSFETFMYTAGTYAALSLLEAYGQPEAGLRDGLPLLLKRAFAGIGVSVAAIGLISLLTLLTSGDAPNWGGYIDYVRRYSGGLGDLPVQFFSTGPVMAAAIFMSAAGTAWISRHSYAPKQPVLAALTGFTGFAVASFTYYLGRSHPNNLYHLIIPVVALGCLWASLLPRGFVAKRNWQVAALGALLLLGGSIVAAAGPSVKTKWPETGFAEAVPFADFAPSGQGRSIRLSLRRLWDRPVIDPRAVSGAALLASALPARQPALVLTEPDLTTEILLRADRRNLLPIAHPREDTLVQASRPRVLNAVAALKSGMLMLTSPQPPVGTVTANGTPRSWESIELIAQTALRRRFQFHVVRQTTDGLQLVELTSGTSSRP